MPLTEAVLAHLWAGQRFPASALVTNAGVPLRVLHPGRRGRGAGPDFRDALVAGPSGAPLRGDIELHRRASDFRAHGHHRDPRYGGLILHVVFDDDADGDTALAGGRTVPVVALAPWARRRAQELAGWLAGPGLWREPCHDAVARLGREGVLSRLAELGDARFGERTAALALEIQACGPGEALYRALLGGLGYGGDRARLAAVAERLPWRALSQPLRGEREEGALVCAEALLLGAAGLLPCQPREAREARWVEIWETQGRRLALESGAVVAEPPPRPGALRPANYPARRLAALAALLARHRPLFEAEGAARALLALPARALIDGWCVPARGYWRRWLAPALAARRPPGALAGRGRAIELLVNAVLPWCAAAGEGDGARAAFAALPRPGRYGALTFLEENFASKDGPLPLDARRQQGLLALYKTECTQGGCGRCVFS
ncbi:MAG: DUF2851 family protein [Chloroflexi bacterium]|nr:DUF2851 family protein [Chloroflexota bacterium]